MKKPRGMKKKEKKKKWFSFKKINNKHSLKNHIFEKYRSFTNMQKRIKFLAGLDQIWNGYVLNHANSHRPSSS